mmetsp:Transcript_83637/g.270644  ORF Transcript_83637/g.270644 Transcript_83637/m.270644 type:complete len:214 (+) Transcript_83637:139-780(+)
MLAFNDLRVPAHLGPVHIPDVRCVWAGHLVFRRLQFCLGLISSIEDVHLVRLGLVIQPQVFVCLAQHGDDVGLDHGKRGPRPPDLLALLRQYLLRVDEVAGTVLQLLVHHLERLCLRLAEHLLLIALPLDLLLLPSQFGFLGLDLCQHVFPFGLASCPVVLHLQALCLQGCPLLLQGLRVRPALVLGCLSCLALLFLLSLKLLALAQDLLLHR